MHDVMFIIILIFIALIFIFIIAQIISPRFRGKMMSRQMKSMKYMIDESKNDIESISTDLANATKEGIEITAHAVKKGFAEDQDIYCKHCGSKTDKNSKFCKNCGKEQ